ncbi:DMT family transporter [Parendozoicomonas haliclonae]|uniref:EamA-like transporter family protein n=1 Tax=Parendozoicomonas haliclonae TaxID=1960125 RepID=A0A1X7AKP4_9GAMM|nr:EamA family transporter [Parendozoicomonas haliclonae]SMA48239.1 EamA-like transporter family protein [Parendozoicomonas haliclonae]
MSAYQSVLKGDNESTVASLVLVLVTLLAAMGWIFSKETIAGLPPLLFIGLRFLLSSALIAPFCRNSLKRMNGRHLALSIRIGLAQSVALMVWIMAISNSSSLGEGAFIASTAMILVPLLGRILYSERIPRPTLLALPVTIAGLALLSLRASWQFEISQALYLIAAFGIALQFVFTSRDGRSIPSNALTFVQFSTVAVCCLLASAAMEEWDLTNVPMNIWLWFLASAVIATAVRYFLLVWCQKRLDSGPAAVIMTLEPLWTALMSAFWLSESLTSLQTVGCGLIMAALFIARRR